MTRLNWPILLLRFEKLSWPVDRCHQEVVFLGVASRGRRKASHNNEHDRLETAEEVCDVEQPQAWYGGFAKHARASVLIVAWFAWIGRGPPFAGVESALGCMQCGQHVVWMSLMCISTGLTGAINHPDCATGRSLSTG